MPNPYAQLLEIAAPGLPLQVATVDAVGTADTLIVSLPGGGAALRVRGVASVGDKVFIRGDLVEGPAPALTLFTAEI